MATAQATGADHGAAPVAHTLPKSRKKLIIVGAVALLAFGGVGAVCVTGLVGRFTSVTTESHASSLPVPGAVDIPEIVANLNAGPRRTSFVRLKARLEISSKFDEAPVQALLPRIQNLFQTYLRDMRPDELRGSPGIYRMREGLIARANTALAPARVTEILFIEMIVQ